MLICSLGDSTEGINDECEFTGGDLYGDLKVKSLPDESFMSVKEGTVSFDVTDFKAVVIE